MSETILDLKNRPNLFGLILANQEPLTQSSTPKEHWVYDGQLLLDQRIGELQTCLDNGIFAAAPEDYPSSSLELPCHYINALSPLLAISETIRQLPESATGLLITDYNQPLIGKEDFLELIKAWEKAPNTIAYTRCRDEIAMPVIIPAKLFSSLWMIAMEGTESNWLEQLIKSTSNTTSVNLTSAKITMESLSFSIKDWMQDTVQAELVH